MIERWVVVEDVGTTARGSDKWLAFVPTSGSCVMK